MITLITGGQRSGKSLFAENFALSHSSTPVYIATARILDDDFRHRVELHRARRGENWTTLEEPLHIGDIHIDIGATALIDCLTLFSTNWLFECGENYDEALAHISTELDTLFTKDANLILVTNELGLGGVSANPLQRKFADLQGTVNQLAAKMADEVYFVVSGIPLRIK